jgi:hypothetical protein
MKFVKIDEFHKIAVPVEFYDFGQLMYHFIRKKIFEKINKYAIEHTTNWGQRVPSGHRVKVLKSESA